MEDRIELELLMSCGVSEPRGHFDHLETSFAEQVNHVSPRNAAFVQRNEREFAAHSADARPSLVETGQHFRLEPLNIEFEKDGVVRPSSVRDQGIEGDGIDVD